MTDKEYMLLHSYLYNNQVRLENELKQQQDNIRFRQIYSVDLVELLYSQIRLDMFKEVSKDIRELMKIVSDKENKK